MWYFFEDGVGECFFVLTELHVPTVYLLSRKLRLGGLKVKNDNKKTHHFGVPFIEHLVVKFVWILKQCVNYNYEPYIISWYHREKLWNFITVGVVNNTSSAFLEK